LDRQQQRGCAAEKQVLLGIVNLAGPLDLSPLETGSDLPVPILAFRPTFRVIARQNESPPARSRNVDGKIGALYRLDPAEEDKRGVGCHGGDEPELIDLDKIRNAYPSPARFTALAAYEFAASCESQRPAS
jgi:hypothetical protein